MNFDFSAEQQQFREQLRRYLEKSQARAATRRVIEGDSAAALPLWRGLADLGALGIAIDEEHGGSGLGLLELCVVAEEVGRALAPVPFLTSVGIVAEALRLSEARQDNARWLPALASGDIIGAVVLPGTGDLRFKDNAIYGEAAPVLDGVAANIAVSPATDGEGRFAVVVCDLSAPGVDRTPVATVDPSRPAARIRFSGAPANLLTGMTAEGWTRLMERAAILLAFEQLGGAETALLMARDYVLERSAFGRKIGSFQAIKHRLADMYVRIELARGHCYYGAWAMAASSDLVGLAAAGARCSATEAMDFASQELIQLHGGMGVTWESDCQLFYRRARLNALLLGAAHQWQDRLVDALSAQQVA
jgi:acyl-CoA dehydrogenase